MLERVSIVKWKGEAGKAPHGFPASARYFTVKQKAFAVLG
jgi:hypothetical protein